MTTPPAPPAHRPLRVLHLTGVLDRGGVETWLLNLFRQVPPEDAAMEILVAAAEVRPGTYDQEFRAAGGKVRLGPSTRHPLTFLAAFWRQLRRGGPYDVVHSHIHHFGGLALLVARLAGVPVRVATSHLDTRRLDQEASRGRALYLALIRLAMRAGATHRLAVSEEAAASLFGARWAADGARLTTLGIDLRSVREARPSPALRAELGLRPGVPVLGHVGLMRPQKNHLFLLELFAHYLREVGPAQLLLVGDGPERRVIEARAAELGLGQSVCFAGSRADVPQLLALMDAFVFPSLYEGLALALQEAYVSGLPCVTSQTVAVLPGARGIEAVALDAPLGDWTAAIHRALERGRQPQTGADFDIAQTAPALVAFYRRARWGGA